MSPIIETPPVKAKPSVDTDILFSIHPELLNDSYIYIHTHVKQMPEELLIRIWKSTFLIGKNVPCRSALIHAENITYAPVWTIVPKNFPYHFLLIFGGLQKDCSVFDVVEQIPEPRGFYFGNVQRNETDVYHLDLSV